MAAHNLDIVELFLHRSDGGNPQGVMQSHNVDLFCLSNQKMSETRWVLQELHRKPYEAPALSRKRWSLRPSWNSLCRTQRKRSSGDTGVAGGCALKAGWKELIARVFSLLAKSLFLSFHWEFQVLENLKGRSKDHQITSFVRWWMLLPKKWSKVSTRNFLTLSDLKISKEYWTCHALQGFLYTEVRA